MYDRTNHDGTGFRSGPRPAGLQLPLQAAPVERHPAFTPRGVVGDAPGVEAAGLFGTLLKHGINLLPF